MLSSLSLLNPLLPFLLLLQPLVQAAGRQALLIFTRSNYILPQPISGMRADTTDGFKCVAAMGLADGEPLGNDKCVYTRYRPGQTWSLDPGIPDTYQAVRIGQGLCLTGPVPSIEGAACRVGSCPTGVEVPPESLWKVGSAGNGTGMDRTSSSTAEGDGRGGFWFRNALNASQCLTADDERDGFFVKACSDSPNQLFGAMQLDPSIPLPQIPVS